MVFLAVSLRPPDPPPLPSPGVKEAGSTLVVTGITLLPVLVTRNVLPSLTVVNVVMTSWVALVVIKVKDGVVASVEMVDVSTSVVVTLPSEFVGVRVDVVTITVVDCEFDVVMVDDSVTTGGVFVGVEVGVEVGVVDVSELVSLLVPPVDRLTLCRLKSAIASSKGSADAADAKSKPAKRIWSLCMMEYDTDGNVQRKKDVETRLLGGEKRLDSGVAVCTVRRCGCG